jgi:hypothetical protein
MKKEEDIVAEARLRTEQIQKRARERGEINLRCPLCSHHLTGIISEDGDYEMADGERCNLYCTWPDCERYEENIGKDEAILGEGPKDNSRCCE